MMSISPHPGQGTVAKFEPSSQNAGHMPWPRGMRIRASNRPPACSNSPRVLMRPDV